jgi:hypothetical protein
VGVQRGQEAIRTGERLARGAEQNPAAA